MRLTGCGACGGPLTQILDLGTSPLADDFPTDPDRLLKRWPITLEHCGWCSLIQLGDVVPDEILWQGDYGFYTGSSSVAVASQQAQARRLLEQFPTTCLHGVVEIACNDGSMLRVFDEAGCPTLGVDPAGGPTEVARKAGLEVWTEPFTAAVAERILAATGQPGLVIANNVIAHVADLADFIAGLRRLLDDPASMAVVEFQYVADLIVGNQFDHLYHEHRRFFSATSLAAALGRHGLHITEIEPIDAQGGSLRCTIRRADGEGKAMRRYRQQEAWLSDARNLRGLQGRADRIRYRLNYLLARLHASNTRVAGYGASAKATTLLNWCGIGSDLVQYMVDTTPTKQGRWMPGTGIPIISPTADSRAPDVYLLTVHNYLPAILRREASFTAGGGRWLVPIPAPVLL